MYSLRMLLDDTKDWYFDYIVYALNVAQMQLLERNYAMHNEHFLAPFYRYDYDLQNGDIIQESDYVLRARVPSRTGVLYPRTCRLYFVSPPLPFPINDYYINCEYVDPEVYQAKNIENVVVDAATSMNLNRKFKTSIYTIIDNKIYFEQPHEGVRAELYYIAIPTPIVINIQDSINVTYSPPEIPPIYIPELLGLAAEILNTKDVLETQRGDFFNVYQGDRKLTFRSVMEIIGGQNG